MAGRDRDKPSWAELDRLRAKGRGDRDRDRDRGGGGGRGQSGAGAAGQKSYRAALERAFENGTLAELARTLSRKDKPKPPELPKPTNPAGEPPPAAGPSGGATKAGNGETNGPGTTSSAAGTGAAPIPSAPSPAPPPDPERENRNKLLQKIRDAEGKEPISRAVDAFLDKYPKLPDDFEVLSKALAHKSDARVLDTLVRLQTLVARDKPRRGRSLIAQLRMLEDTHGDAEIRTLAAAVRSRL
jgi:hypothetical protein